MLRGALSALGAAFAVSRANAAAESLAQEKQQDKLKQDKLKQDKLKVVYHLSDLDKAGFVIGNIQNHLDGVGGPDHVTIALVVHGPALRAFHSAQANPELTQHVGRLSKAGVGFAACGNTMKSQKVALGDLLPGFVTADKGGVVRIAELQSQGYLYLRP
jgi:intracellular sulfur oxidation DsrE/DsrF family protein